MGLSEFHAVFIALSTLLCVLIACWGIFDSVQGGGLGSFSIGAVGLAGAACLLRYRTWFHSHRPGGAK